MILAIKVHKEKKFQLANGTSLLIVADSAITPSAGVWQRLIELSSVGVLISRGQSGHAWSFVADLRGHSLITSHAIQSLVVGSRSASFEVRGHSGH